MATRTTVVAELRRRLGDTGADVWSDDMLDGYVDTRIKGAYPTFFQYEVDTTTPGAGPIQTAPSGCSNIYRIGFKRNSDATRVRYVRGWTEGNGEAVIPKLNINVSGALLIWSWTAGWDAPASDGATLTIPKAAEEWVIVGSHINALEFLLTNRLAQEKYFALQVRQAGSEDDIAQTLDALHISLKEKADRALPLPEVVR